MDLGKSNLNRSFSEPDFQSSPSCFRQVFVNECYQFPNYDKPQIRRYMYTEVVGGFNGSDNILLESKKYRSEKSLREFHKSGVKWLHRSNSPHLVSQFDDQSFSSSFQKKKEEEPSNQKFNFENLKLSHIRSEEAMDADDDSDCEEICEYNDHSKFDNVRRRLNEKKPGRRLNTSCWTQHPHKKQRDNSKLHCTIYFLVPIIISLLCYVLWLHLFQKEDEPTHIIPDLKNVLYQDHVVQITSRILNNLNKESSKEILVFVGTTGVGKTYLVNLIKKHFHKEFIIDVNIILQKHFNTANKLSQKGCYFIIIDNLKIENLEPVAVFVNMLPNQCILVIPVFNIQEISDDLTYTTNIDYFRRIKKKFDGQFSKIANVVLFNNMNRDKIEKWLRLQIEEKEFSNKEETISFLLEKHNVEDYGFKGLVPKINLLQS
ncbi:hypothetical protein AMK59_5520 [Oryctes borbonicus]|uniref:Uncharacterized protein n=1 Tax=Oryctes borbonicus TaxID=1629725 RepID=A0A0T6B0C8_9SCAR|nr:hypothetical protein AMK59_5520 [Oryctes borbonicus]